MQEVGPNRESSSSAPRGLGNAIPLLPPRIHKMNTVQPLGTTNHTQVNCRRKEKYDTSILRSGTPSPFRLEAEHSKLQRTKLPAYPAIAIGGAIGTASLGSTDHCADCPPSSSSTQLSVASSTALRAMGEILLPIQVQVLTDFIPTCHSWPSRGFVGWSYLVLLVSHLALRDVIAITSYVHYWLPDV